MENFYLFRIDDESGVSGLGYIAEGTRFTNKKVVLAWRTDKTSVAVYDDVDTLIAIHGHNGKTVIVWDDTDWINEKGEPIGFGGTGWSNLKTNEWIGSGPFKEWVRPSVYLAGLK